MHNSPFPRRNRWVYYLSICFFLVGLAGAGTCVMAGPKPVQSKIRKAKQGICGLVVEKRGNHMPSVDSPGVGTSKAVASGTPVGREVLIFPLLNMSQVDAGDNGFINSVRDAKPVKTVQSDKNGKFCVDLPVGRYSVMVREPKGLYANLSDTQNNIFPVTVQKNRQSVIKVEITHQAVF